MKTILLNSKYGICLFTILYIVILHSQGSVVKEKPGEELECEACQYIVDKFVTQLHISLPSDHPIRKPGTEIKPEYIGMASVKIVEINENVMFCDYSAWKDFADLSTHPVYKLTKECEGQLPEMEDDLENYASRGMSIKDIQKILCNGEEAKKKNSENSKENVKNNLHTKRDIEKTKYNKCPSGLWNSGNQILNRMNIKDVNIQISDQLIEENKKKSDVITTKTGLQYKIHETGDKDDDICVDSSDAEVEVIYKGTKMATNEQFDTTKTGETSKFNLNRVVPGFQEGIKYMCQGDRFQFFLHPSLAYGSTGAGNSIGPNEAIVFDVQLIKVITHTIKRSHRNKKETKGQEPQKDAEEKKSEEKDQNEEKKSEVKDQNIEKKSEVKDQNIEKTKEKQEKRTERNQEL